MQLLPKPRLLRQVVVVPHRQVVAIAVVVQEVPHRQVVTIALVLPLQQMVARAVAVATVLWQARNTK